MQTYGVDDVFVDICLSGNIRNFNRYLEIRDANQETLEQGLKMAVLRSNVEITKRLISRDVRTSDMLTTAACRLYTNIREDIHQSNSYTKRMKKYAMEVLLYILDNCKVDPRIDFNCLPSPAIENESSLQAKKIIKDILNEYVFRLDGPVYNENIIA
uniref:Uncharacterized protein n=1 Tax=viral metagenome TaxID=1070528 RepID=A0A6C0JWW2_9ZZZZ